jgi:transcriptional regulator with XRE-family HTH domain
VTSSEGNDFEARLRKVRTQKEGQDVLAAYEQDYAQAVKEERTRRGWTIEEAARRGGASYKTWQRIENGQPIQDTTFLKVDRAFGLQEGTAFRVWNRNQDLRNALIEANWRRARDPDYPGGTTGTAQASLGALGIGSSEQGPAFTDEARGESPRNADEQLRNIIAIVARLPYEQILQLRAAVDSVEKTIHHQLEAELTEVSVQLEHALQTADTAEAALADAEREFSKMDESDDPRMIEIFRTMRDQTKVAYQATRSRVNQLQYRMTRLQEILDRDQSEEMKR